MTLGDPKLQVCRLEAQGLVPSTRARGRVDTGAAFGYVRSRRLAPEVSPRVRQWPERRDAVCERPFRVLDASEAREGDGRVRTAPSRSKEQAGRASRSFPLGVRSLTPLHLVRKGRSGVGPSTWPTGILATVRCRPTGLFGVQRRQGRPDLRADLS